VEAGAFRCGDLLVGLLLALPILVALLITNLALAILSRAAPQLNLIAIGFPLTITLGFAGLMFGLSYLANPLQQLFEYGLQSMLGNFSTSRALGAPSPGSLRTIWITPSA
jgi:flagellar biosynthesis protein FliR